MEVSEAEISSWHHQALNRVADPWKVVAHAPDGVIEAVRLTGAKSFTVGVQWHAEWGLEEHELSKQLFKKFGEAAREHARTRKHVVGA